MLLLTFDHGPHWTNLPCWPYPWPINIASLGRMTMEEKLKNLFSWANGRTVECRIIDSADCLRCRPYACLIHHTVYPLPSVIVLFARFNSRNMAQSTIAVSIYLTIVGLQQRWPLAWCVLTVECVSYICRVSLSFKLIAVYGRTTWAFCATTISGSVRLYIWCVDTLSLLFRKCDIWNKVFLIYYSPNGHWLSTRILLLHEYCNRCAPTYFNINSNK